MHYTFLRGVNWETKMGLHEEFEDQSFSDYNYDEEIDDHIDDLNQKRKSGVCLKIGLNVSV